jgi:NAD(P)H-hydrate epimerase
LVTAAVISEDYPILAGKLVEGMTRPVSTGPRGTFHPASIDDMTDLLDTADAIAVGPGMGTEEEVVEFLERLLTVYKGPVVIDADGIKNLKGMENLLRDRELPGVITPHPGEFSALTGMSKEDILSDRIKAASDLSEKLNAAVVLKGAQTVITEPGGNTRINLTGNPGMATAGSGDVLTGVIAGLLAQGYPPFDASTLGVFLHGLAGDLACAEMGEMGLIASDLVNYLPKAFTWLKELD